jgi:hypothetical protein
MIPAPTITILVTDEDCHDLAIQASPGSAGAGGHTRRTG